MIKIEKNILTKKYVEKTKDILKELKWVLARDSEEYRKNMFDDKTNFQGMSRVTNIEPIGDIEKKLNEIGMLVTKIICNRISIKPKKIHRFMWNLYKQGEKGSLHEDEKYDNFISIVYCLNSSDGYLEVNNQKIYDIEDEARVFKSKLLHKGVGPTKNLYRLNLNVLLEL